MFGSHWAELILVLGIAAIIFGPKRLPEIGAGLGKGIRDFRKSIHEIEEEVGVNELRALPAEMASTMTAPVVPPRPTEELTTEAVTADVPAATPGQP